ncbi:MAG: hypothetical protein LBS93_02545 [Synergistaceae bacterium]|jgi:hypothetical protein|nr:hypothetical protein [Synergistaceae bacterium]
MSLLAIVSHIFMSVILFTALAQKHLDLSQTIHKNSTPVYNNFTCDTIDEQKNAISTAAQNVLDARELFPDNSLADLYNPLTMPPELLKAHKVLDRLVMRAYSFSVKDSTEASIVAALMKRYQVLLGGRSI